MSTAPLVTVIIPTYNYGRYICEAIDSVLASSFPQSEIEIIVIDDGSTDGTRRNVRAYGERVQYIFQENQGKASATQLGVERAKGKYLFNLDADDYFLPEKIAEVVAAFDSDEEITHVGHPAVYLDTRSGAQSVEPHPAWLTGRKISGREVLLNFYKKRVLFGGGSTFAARTEVLRSSAIPKDVDMLIDEYLVLVTLNKGYSYFIGRPLSVWRIHGENFSGVDAGGHNYAAARDKDERGMSSMDAVLSSVLSGDFDPDIKMLYTLKAKVSRIAMSENARRKSCSDVIDLWKYVIGTFGVFGKESFEIMRRYTVLNRTLPTPVLRLARRAVNKSV
jgi:glycosyltransferase involved in cell wall biosynthesis